MIDLLVHLFAFLVTIPLLATLLVFVVLKWKYTSSGTAFRKSAQWTAIFYVIAVDLILSDLFQFHVLFFIILFFILIAGLILVGQYKVKGRLLYGRAVDIAWRMFFFDFLCALCRPGCSDDDS
ncbi:DUF3397 family protein [Virgibacillus halophilus]|uniref:DUF3397 family protein n=1 Tax=Tigheibacillus halophilus TaxID=361280 RepID=A0ABU5CCL3_9BACI|nr:DUF3397 family protein [Virgibacillus halophilus]